MQQFLPVGGIVHTVRCTVVVMRCPTDGLAERGK